MGQDKNKTINGDGAIKENNALGITSFFGWIIVLEISLANSYFNIVKINGINIYVGI